MELQFEINNQIIQRTDTEKPVQLSRNYLQCYFDFKSAEWDGVDKFAIFRNENNKSYTCHLGTENVCECTAPVNALTGSFFRVSVYGGDLITSNIETVLLLKSGYTTNISPDTPHSKDVFEEIFEKLGEKIDDVTYEDELLKFYADEVVVCTVDPTDFSYSWESIVDIPETFPPSHHTHTASDVTGLDGFAEVEIKKSFRTLKDAIRTYNGE